MAPPSNQNPNGFWDFIQNLSNQPNQYHGHGHGHGVDHHGPHGHHHQAPFPPQFGPGFPFSGGWGYGPPPPPQPPCPPGPPGAPGASRGPWDADFDWGVWFGDGSGREGRREWRRECRRRRRENRRGGAATDEEGQGEQSGRHGETETEGELEKEKGESPDTVDADMPDPEEVAPEDAEQPPPYGFGRRGGHWGRGGHHRGRGHHHGGPHRRGGGPRGQAPFDFQGMMRGFMNHPFFQGLREQAEQYQSNRSNDNNNNNTNADDAVESFSPPADIFNTPQAFVIHVALPGTKKEDIGVNWNPDNNTLNIAGVVHRPGDEEFIQTMVSGERKVGMFERSITLPPPGVTTDNEDVDGLGITAKMEDGILIVTVPKIEKEWTEVRKVDIQ